MVFRSVGVNSTATKTPPHLFHSAVGSLGQSLHDDGLCHSTATVPRDVKLRLFASLMIAAREDAARLDSRNLNPPKQRTKETPELYSFS